MEEARSLWQRALEANPDSPLAKERLEKLKNEAAVESDFKQVEGLNFDIRFDKNAEGYDAYDIKDYLREAYRDIGKDLGYYPQHMITVLVYSENTAQKALPHMPEWSEGIFDGKIRLPALKGDIDEKRLRAILWHEYTHAVIYDLALGNCPAWLNEGIAVYEEAKYAALDMKLLRDAYLENRLLSVQGLLASFADIKERDMAALAYLQAYTMMEYFIDRYGFWYLARLLESIKNQKDIDRSMKEILLITTEEFEREWLKFIKEKYI